MEVIESHLALDFCFALTTMDVVTWSALITIHKSSETLSADVESDAFVELFDSFQVQFDCLTFPPCSKQQPTDMIL